MNDDQRSDAEAKLAAPKLFGRKKTARTPEPAVDPDEAATPATAPIDGPIDEPVPAPAPAPEPGPEPDPDPIVEQPAAVEETRPLAPVPAEQTAVETVEPVAPPQRATGHKPKESEAPKPQRERRPLPRLSGMQVAAIAGVIVGLFLVLATYGSLHLCASVRGAQTCGGKAGFPLLLAIGIVAVVGGGALLRLYAVRSPIGDSFLAVALVAVITVLFLGNHYDAWWMLIVVPVLSLLAYLLAHWVSVTYIDPVDD